MRSSWLVLIVCAVMTTAAELACAGSFGARPIYSYSVEAMGGNCTAYTAVDSRGLKQQEQGCEARSSGVKTRRVSASQLARIERAFAELPPPPVLLEETDHCPDLDTRYMLAVQRDDGARHSWSFCRGAQGFRAPYDEAVAALTDS